MNIAHTDIVNNKAAHAEQTIAACAAIVMNMPYSSILVNAMSWAREAGAVHRRYFRTDELDIATKLNEADIVTAADKAAERLVIDRIRATYPSHAILSEESGASGAPDDSKADGYRWVIDPLDGTTNFAQGLPVYCVSIGVEHEGRTVVGVVYDSYLDEMFTAVEGEGAMLNGRPIHASLKTDLAQCVVSTGFPVDRATNPDCNIDNTVRVLPHVRGLRRLGSAAMDLCYVAAGILDAYWEMNLHPWDVAAGMLIATEAGASVTRFRHDRGISVLAAAPGVFPLIRPLLSSQPCTRRFDASLA